MIQGFIIGRLGAAPTTLKSAKGRDFKSFNVACDDFENGNGQVFIVEGPKNKSCVYELIQILYVKKIT